MSTTNPQFDKEKYNQMIEAAIFQKKMDAKREVLSYYRHLWMTTWGRLIQATCFAVSWSIIVGFLIVPQLIGGWWPNWQWAMALLGFVIAFLWYIRK